MDDVIDVLVIGMAISSFGFACYFWGEAVATDRFSREIRELREKV